MRRPPLLALLLAACTAVDERADAPEAFQLEGTVTWEGHFERPHATRTIPISVLLLVAGDRVRCELTETWALGQPPERTVFVRDEHGCRMLAPGSSRFATDRGEGERLLRLLVAATRRATATPLTIAWQHPRLGDVEDEAAWRAGPEGAGLNVVWHRAHDQAVLVLRPAPAAPITRAIAAFDDAEASPAPTPAQPPAARFATLAAGVHELVLSDVSTRSIVVEFADHLVVCETSVDSHAGERLVAALDQRLPGKPVRWVLFGHYHPHYTGGLRPFMARGAIVVAPPLGAAFATTIAARPFSSPPDALAASGRAPAIETFSGQRTFRDATNELVAIDIGAASHHTDEYVVFYLPRQRLLFQGDLGWFGGTPSLRAGGDRARGLLRAIDERALDVETLVQGWPAGGRGTLPLRDLRALLAR